MTEALIIEKLCTGPCGRALPLSMYFTSDSSADGLRHRCKDCMRVGRERRRQENVAALEPLAEKRCAGPCGLSLPMDRFHVHASSKDGHRDLCKACRSKHAKENKRTVFEEVTEKVCIKCGEMQPIGNYDLSSVNRDGRVGKCKTCRKTYGADWHAANREENNQISRDYHEANKEQAHANAKQWRKDNPEKTKVLRRKWAKNNPGKICKRFKRRHAERRIEALIMMGPFCECCNETDLRALTFDHKFGNGAEHRRAIGGSQKANSNVLIRWIQANPAEAREMLRVLCWNCNAMAWKNNGTCPHQELSIIAMAIEQQALKIAA